LETTLKIEDKIEGFSNKQNDGMKVYMKGRIIKWVIDSDRFLLCDLISYLSDEYEGRDVKLVSES
jgi:hypothetical protein